MTNSINYKPTIIYEDENVLVINKPAGLLVHTAPGIKKEETLTKWLVKNYPEVKNVGDLPAQAGNPKLRPGIVHRLDKETSGVLIAAKNQKTFEYLKKQFQERKIKKTYIALVKGIVKNNKGIINTPIKRFTKSREAETEYKVIKRYKGYTLLQASPKTGRTHQIRIHLKSIGHPIVCDKVYTKKPDCPFGLKRHFLHAQSLELTLPNNNRIKLEADMPKDLQKTLIMINKN